MAEYIWTKQLEKNGVSPFCNEMVTITSARVDLLILERQTRTCSYVAEGTRDRIPTGEAE